MKKIVYTITLLLMLVSVSCDSGMKVNGKKVISDLAFHKTESQKEYADLILHAIKTNRDKVILEELADKSIDPRKLNKIISAYSQSIGNKDWDFVDDPEHKESGSSRIVDYTWLDKRGRTAIQINIHTTTSENEKFTLNRVEFRSRLDILESEAFPGGPISDYKKLAEN